MVNIYELLSHLHGAALNGAVIAAHKSEDGRHLRWLVGFEYIGRTLHLRFVPLHSILILVANDSALGELPGKKRKENTTIHKHCLQSAYSI